MCYFVVVTILSGMYGRVAEKWELTKNGRWIIDGGEWEIGCVILAYMPVKIETIRNEVFFYVEMKIWCRSK